MSIEGIMMYGSESFLNTPAPVELPIPPRVTFNGPATIVFWDNGDKTVVKCSEDDTFDKKTGFLMAYYRYHSRQTRTQVAKALKRICEVEE